MFGWTEFEVAREQHQDRLRSLERQRNLGRFEAGHGKPSLWQSVGRLVGGDRKKDLVGRRHQLAEESVPTR